MPNLLKGADPVARKRHRCTSCRATIEPGTRYSRDTYLGDDGLYEWVSCRDCRALSAVVWDWCGRPDEGFTEEDMAEWAQEVRDDPTHGESARAYIARRFPTPSFHNACRITEWSIAAAWCEDHGVRVYRDGVDWATWVAGK